MVFKADGSSRCAAVVPSPPAAKRIASESDAITRADPALTIV